MRCRDSACWRTGASRDRAPCRNIDGNFSAQSEPRRNRNFVSGLISESNHMPNTTGARRARLAAFAPHIATAGASTPRREISGMEAYRLREPASGRSYTVLKLQARGGLEGYGECSEVSPAHVAQVLSAVRGKDATQFETVR